MATYDYELTLISPGGYTEDAIGNKIPIAPVETTILCDRKSATRGEYYQAAAAGLKPEEVFVAHAYEYGGQKLVRFDGILYSVIRTYQVGIEEIELTCERKGGNG